MKPAPIHPAENSYYWTDADKIVDFAMANGMKVRGHTLLLASADTFMDVSWCHCNKVTKDVLLQRVKRPYKKQWWQGIRVKVYAWDVVNEAIDDDNSKTYRESSWYTICGEEYIASAFIMGSWSWSRCVAFFTMIIIPKSASKREKIYNMNQKTPWCRRSCTWNRTSGALVNLLACRNRHS